MAGVILAVIVALLAWGQVGGGGPAAVAQAPNNPATGTVTLTTNGRVEIHYALIATVSATDLDGLADPVLYTYTWFYVTPDPDSTTCAGRQIAGRHSIDNETLTIIRHDAGKRICVRVEFQDDAGNEEALESLPTIKIPSGAVIEGEYIDVFGAVQYDITVNTVVGTTLRANTDFVGDYSDLAATPNFTFQWIYWRAGNVGLDGDDGDIQGRPAKSIRSRSLTQGGTSRWS